MKRWTGVLGVVFALAVLLGCSEREPKIEGTTPTLPVLKPGGPPGAPGNNQPAGKPKPAVE